MAVLITLFLHYWGLNCEKGASLNIGLKAYKSASVQSKFDVGGQHHSSMLISCELILMTVENRSTRRKIPESGWDRLKLSPHASRGLRVEPRLTVLGGLIHTTKPPWQPIIIIVIHVSLLENRIRPSRAQLRTVPTIVIAHTFYASPDTRISYRRCLLIQGYFCAV